MNNKSKDLKVRTKRFARQIIRFYGGLSRDTVSQVLGKQLLRSGTSIGANCREASRGRSKAEFIAKVGDCLKEADETVYWLELVFEESVAQSNKVSSLLAEANELVAIFVAVSNNARSS